MFKLTLASPLFQWWLGLFVLVSAAPAISCELATDIPKAECEEVKTLARATEYSGTIEAFDTATRICLLPGIICSDGHVSGFKYELSIGSNTSIRPATDALPVGFNALTSLTYLELRGANVASAFPDMSLLTALETLKITGSTFNSGIHASLSQLPNLKTVEISQSTLPAATFPAFYSSQLQDLTLSGTNLSGDLSNLNLPLSLRTLIVDNNALTGTVINLNTWQNLTSLSLANNQIAGNVEGLGLPVLRVLDLSHNQLLQFNLNSLPVLKTLNLANNNLTVFDGASLSEQSPNLASLSLNDNQLSGFITGMYLDNLDKLLLQNNQITGFADTNNFKALTELNLSGNQVTDSVNLLALNTAAPRLLSLDLSQNNMTTLHPNLSFPRLISLSLENNSLTQLPFLPQVTPQLCTLDASHNQFATDINVFAGQFGHGVLKKTLQTIDLSNNQLSGTMNDLPFNIARGHSLNLSFNQLSGSVPPIISTSSEVEANLCTKLTGSISLDFSNNQFSNVRADFLQNIDAVNPYAVDNIFGENLVVNLENNQLCGEIGNLVIPTNLSNATEVRVANNYLYTQRLDVIDYFDTNIPDWSQQKVDGQCEGGQRFSTNTFSVNDETNQFSLQVYLSPPESAKQQTTNVYFVAQVLPTTCSMKDQATGQAYELPQNCTSSDANLSPYWIIFNGSGWNPWQGEALEAIASTRQQVLLTTDIFTIFNNASLALLLQSMNVYKGALNNSDGTASALIQNINFDGSVPTTSASMLTQLSRPEAANVTYLDYVSPDSVVISPIQIFAGYGDSFVDMVEKAQFQHIYSITKTEIEQFSELHSSYYQQ
ncbi:leucine-rich repeat domain-containing protein [Candidatus Albibeggiatoa sp. nov. BB20]|uniref:leucine-rich repeat domain-containing protein n=1 Tax=Candidatus Albibeggiatoa sp. nov. BB20 TaxID=3162723 RepID=UPI0033653303